MEKLEMITKEDKERAHKILALINKSDKTDEQNPDHECWEMHETMMRMMMNLEIAPQSYRAISEEDKKERFFETKCDKCGWWGSSKLLSGGQAIADTGDYDDSCCPVCGNLDLED